MTRLVKVARPLALLALLFAAAAPLAGPQPIAAAEPGIEFTAETADEGAWKLNAAVTGADGSVLSQVPVTFVMETDFFGDRWIPLGTSATSTSGVATLIYIPTSNGDHRILASAATGEGSLESQPLVVHVDSAVPAIPVEGPDLPIVRAWALPIGISVVLLVWIVLAAIFLFAVLGIARHPEVVEVPRPAPGVDDLETMTPRVDGGSDS